MTNNITAIDCILTDTDIRIIVKITAQSMRSLYIDYLFNSHRVFWLHYPYLLKTQVYFVFFPFITSFFFFLIFHYLSLFSCSFPILHLPVFFVVLLLFINYFLHSFFSSFLLCFPLLHFLVPLFMLSFL